MPPDKIKRPKGEGRRTIGKAVAELMDELKEDDYDAYVVLDKYHQHLREKAYNYRQRIRELEADVNNG